MHNLFCYSRGRNGHFGSIHDLHIRRQQKRRRLLGRQAQFVTEGAVAFSCGIQQPLEGVDLYITFKVGVVPEVAEIVTGGFQPEHFAAILHRSGDIAYGIAEAWNTLRVRDGPSSSCLSPTFANAF